MRIVCPACHAAYEVPATLLPPGQAVRCARCAREWVPEAEEPAATPASSPADPPPMATSEPVAAAEPTPPPARPPITRRPPPARQAAPRNMAVRLAWVATLVVIAALLWAGYSQREAIMQAWPPSARVYDALGLTAQH